MRDRLIFAGQFIFTALVAAFLVVPALLSISAGITVNYFRGIQSGVTLQWIAQVWELYAGTILLSFLVAFATLAITLVAGVPAAYALHGRGGRLSVGRATALFRAIATPCITAWGRRSRGASGEGPCILSRRSSSCSSCWRRPSPCIGWLPGSVSRPRRRRAAARSARWRMFFP